MAGILADMRRTVLAILAGVAVSTGLVGMLVLPLTAEVQEVVARLLPAAVSDRAYGLTVELVTAGLLVTPGVALAVLLARRRDYPPGNRAEACERHIYSSKSI